MGWSPQFSLNMQTCKKCLLGIFKVNCKPKLRKQSKIYCSWKFQKTTILIKITTSLSGRIRLLDNKLFLLLTTSNEKTKTSISHLNWNSSPLLLILPPTHQEFKDFIFDNRLFLNSLYINKPYSFVFVIVQTIGKPIISKFLGLKLVWKLICSE